MAYPNGEVPLTKLVHVRNNIWLPAGTLARWNWAVEQGVKKYGVRLRITGEFSSAWNTWNGYRPLSAQILYKNKYGNLAASPRFSSHGGWYRGQEVFAIDVDNWRDLAPGNERLAWARFVALMRLAGLTTDFVSPREQWHVGDFNNPWIIPAFASGGGGSHINPTPKPAPKLEEEEEDTMKVFGYKKPGDTRTRYVTMDFAGGLWDESVSDNESYGPSIAKNWGRGAPMLSLAHRDSLAAKFNLRWPDLASMTVR